VEKAGLSFEVNLPAVPVPITSTRHVGKKIVMNLRFRTRSSLRSRWGLAVEPVPGGCAPYGERHGHGIPRSETTQGSAFSLQWRARTRARTRENRPRIGLRSFTEFVAGCTGTAPRRERRRQRPLTVPRAERECAPSRGETSEHLGVVRSGECRCPCLSQ